jgi:hypothetical protein
MTEDIRQLIAAGRVRLVDNRIVVGDSTWALEQPRTICVLHPKQNKAEHREFVKALLDVINERAAETLRQKEAALTSE